MCPQAPLLDPEAPLLDPEAPLLDPAVLNYFPSLDWAERAIPAYPNLNQRTAGTIPFTTVSTGVSAHAAGSFINPVSMTSVMSADNHALFGASRLLFARVVDGNAPRFVDTLNCLHVPWAAVLAASTTNGLCFGASYMSEGQLWSWLQNIVNKSKQVSWISIGLASLRFRAGIRALNFQHLLPCKNWT
jgi:AAT family amino acid transporter